MRVLFSRLLLALVAIGVVVLSAEVAGRLIWGTPVFMDQRLLIVSKDLWRLDDSGAMRYTPDREARSVAIFGNHVEYDARFPINDLGFVDDRDYGTGPGAAATSRIAIVGDSFTAGFHGGSPWVPRLRDRVETSNSGVEIYNLGIGGVGIPNFGALLKSMARQGFVFDRVAIVLITDDLFRGRWRPIEHESALHMCPIESSIPSCVAASTRILLLPGDDATRSELLALARQSGLIREPAGAVEWLSRHSFIASRLRLAFSPYSVAPRPTDQPGMQRVGRIWLGRLRASFPDLEITILHLPQKHETENERFDLELKRDALEAGFEYVSLLEECDLTPADYFAVDNHPNRAGYDKILTCVGRGLGVLM